MRRPRRAKQADVPAAVTAAAATTPAADAAAMATAQPPTETAEAAKPRRRWVSDLRSDAKKGGGAGERDRGVGGRGAGGLSGKPGHLCHQEENSRRCFQEIKGSCAEFPKVTGANSAHLHSQVFPSLSENSGRSVWQPVLDSLAIALLIELA